MKLKLKVFIECEPPKTTAQQKGVRVITSKKTGKPFAMHYRKKKVQVARDTFKELFAPYAPSKPLSGALSVKVYFLFPFRKSESKKIIRSGWLWKTTKPDLVNLEKEPVDVLTELGFFTDDAIICEEIIRKAWAKRTGIYLEINELGAGCPDDLIDIVYKLPSASDNEEQTQLFE